MPGQEMETFYLLLLCFTNSFRAFKSTWNETNIHFLNEIIFNQNSIFKWKDRFFSGGVCRFSKSFSWLIFRHFLTIDCKFTVRSASIQTITHELNQFFSEVNHNMEEKILLYFFFITSPYIKLYKVHLVPICNPNGNWGLTLTFFAH